MTRDEYITGWCYFRCGVGWEARRAWEYVQLHGDPFGFFNLPALTMPKCTLRCRRCKTELDIDFAVIRGAEVYDYDCENCYRCNCFSSTTAIKKLDAFRARCERYEREWHRVIYSDDENEDDEQDAANGGKRRRTGVALRLRWQVLRRDNFTCRYCGASAESAELHVDHVISRADGGSDEIGNLVTACIPCNLGKGSESMPSMKPYLGYLPERQY
jgi:5-methylcytosine-specific restriction endonuclease McrA